MEKGIASGPGAPLPPTLIYLAGFLPGLWLEDRVPLWPEWTAPGAVETVGWVLVLVGTLLFIWGMSTFSRMQTGIMLQQAATRVVDVPPYSWSRNPMYVSFTVMYVGFALAGGLWWPFLLLPAVIAILSAAVITREERYMRRTFGAVYEDYCARVRRWL
jgi:protein-S-isoprenylcysteine O-methyltransferase Ste14